MALRLTFLGTSAGLPTKERNVSGIAAEFLVSSEQKVAPWVLVDCGDGTLSQILKTPLKLFKLTAVLITHLHGDHCFGLANLFNTLSMQGFTKPLTIIAPKALIKLLDSYTLVCELYFNFEVRFLPIEEHLLAPVVLGIGRGRLAIDVIALSHRMPSYGFAINYTQNHHTLQIKQKIVIAGDNDNPDLLINAVQDCQALVHECTYTQAVAHTLLAKGKINPQHTHAKQIAQFAHNVGIPLLILTHFSARYASFDNPNSSTPNMGHIRTEVQKYYDGRCILAKDLMSISL